MDPSLINIVFIDWRVKKLGQSRHPGRLKVVYRDDGTNSCREFVDLLKKVYKSVTLFASGKEAISLLKEKASANVESKSSTNLAISESPLYCVLIDIPHTELENSYAKEGTDDASLYGIGLLNTIESDSSLRKIAMPIAVGTFSDTDMVSSLMRRGAVDYLLKPIGLSSVKMLWLNVQRWQDRERLRLLDQHQHNKSPSTAGDHGQDVLKLPHGSITSSRSFADIITTYYSAKLDVALTDYPSLLSQDRKIQLNDALSSWNFDAQLFNHDELLHMVFLMFDNMAIFEHFQISPDTFKMFSLAVRANYRDNPYHNFRHAVDVLQASYFFLLRSVRNGTAISKDKPPELPTTCPLSDVARFNVVKDNEAVAGFLRPIEHLALLVASYCHDVGHPGVNNFFEINAQSPLALLYSDKSVLESYHSSLLFSILRNDDFNFLCNLSIPERNEFRNTVVTAILATDMACHFEYVKKIQERINKFKTDSGGLSLSSKDDRALLSATLIKSADIGNAARPFPIAHRWADVLLLEFFAQGDLEKRLGYPLFILADRDTVVQPKSQVDFITILALPLFEVMKDLIPGMSFCVNYLESNRSAWNRRLEEQSQPPDVLLNEGDPSGPQKETKASMDAGEFHLLRGNGFHVAVASANSSNFSLNELMGGAKQASEGSEMQIRTTSSWRRNSLPISSKGLAHYAGEVPSKVEDDAINPNWGGLVVAKSSESESAADNSSLGAYTGIGMLGVGSSARPYLTRRRGSLPARPPAESNSTGIFYLSAALMAVQAAGSQASSNVDMSSMSPDVRREWIRQTLLSQNPRSPGNGSGGRSISSVPEQSILVDKAHSADEALVLEREEQSHPKISASTDV